VNWFKWWFKRTCPYLRCFWSILDVYDWTKVDVRFTIQLASSKYPTVSYSNDFPTNQSPNWRVCIRLCPDKAAERRRIGVAQAHTHTHTQGKTQRHTFEVQQRAASQSWKVRLLTFLNCCCCHCRELVSCWGVKERDSKVQERGVDWCKRDRHKYPRQGCRRRQWRVQLYKNYLGAHPACQERQAVKEKSGKRESSSERDASRQGERERRSE